MSFSSSWMTSPFTSSSYAKNITYRARRLGCSGLVHSRYVSSDSFTQAHNPKIVGIASAVVVWARFCLCFGNCLPPVGRLNEGTAVGALAPPPTICGRRSTTRQISESKQNGDLHSITDRRRRRDALWTNRQWDPRREVFPIQPTVGPQPSELFAIPPAELVGGAVQYPHNALFASSLLNISRCKGSTTLARTSLRRQQERPFGESLTCALELMLTLYGHSSSLKKKGFRRRRRRKSQTIAACTSGCKVRTTAAFYTRERTFSLFPLLRRRSEPGRRRQSLFGAAQ